MTRFWSLLAPACLLTCLALAACGGPGDSTEGDPSPDVESDPAMGSALNSVVEHERAFSRRSVEAGMRTAFLEFMAEDIVLFRPQPSRGLSSVREAPELEGTLSWGPAQAEVSVAGDLGYTTGPFRVEREGGAASHGHYLTVWQRENDGGGAPTTWMAVVDAGISHGPVPAADDVVDYEQPRPPFQPPDVAPLLDADRMLEEAVASRGPEAYRDSALPRLRMHLSGAEPLLGMEAVLTGLEALAAAPVSVPEGGGVSTDGSLGYTWGRLEGRDGGEVEGGYVRVWRGAADGWRLAVEVRTGAG